MPNFDVLKDRSRRDGRERTAARKARKLSASERVSTSGTRDCEDCGESGYLSDMVLTATGVRCELCDIDRESAVARSDGVRASVLWGPTLAVMFAIPAAGMALLFSHVQVVALFLVALNGVLSWGAGRHNIRTLRSYASELAVEDRFGLVASAVFCYVLAVAPLGVVAWVVIG